MASHKPRRWTDEQLRQAVESSLSVAETLRKLGLRDRGDNYKTVARHVERLGLCTEHFLGCAHLRGKGRDNLAVPLETVLVPNSPYRNASYLAIRLCRAGLLQNCCAECGMTEWRGRTIPLQLDHVNGDHRDHRLANLRLLCPNCHSLTPTYCGKNSRRNRLERESGSHA